MRLLADEGMTGAEIAKQLSRKYGVYISRNSVMGKCHRLGGVLKRKIAQPVIRTVPNWKKRAAKLAKELDAAKPISGEKLGRQLTPEERIWGRTAFLNPKARSVDFMELTNRHCRYPTGDVRTGTIRFCGADKINPASAYCDYCHNLVYIPGSKMGERNGNSPRSS